VKLIYSLKGRNLFKEVYQKGRRIQDSGIRVYSLKSVKSEHVKPDYGNNISKDTKQIKIAIALTKSFGNACIRNSAKRRMRAICAGLFNEMRDGFYIIIRIDSEFKNFPYDDQKRVIRSLFSRAGLLNSDANNSV
jgi:ribonuclease P protein component